MVDVEQLVDRDERDADYDEDEQEMDEEDDDEEEADLLPLDVLMPPPFAQLTDGELRLMLERNQREGARLQAELHRRRAQRHVRNAAAECGMCFLAVDVVAGCLLSCSWDKTAKLWPLARLKSGDATPSFTLTGHQAAVWGITLVKDRPGHYITASADTILALWHQDQPRNTFRGHKDVVRCAVCLDGVHFASCGNDADIRIWNMDTPVCLATFSSVGGEYLYSDSTVWIFTHDGGRKASDEQIAVYTSEVDQYMLAQEEAKKKKMSDVITIKVDTDEGNQIDLNYRKGDDPWDSATKFVQQHNLPSHHIQMLADFIVQNVPESRNAGGQTRAMPPSGEKKLYRGKEWDFLFEISLEDGKDLKLAYNRGEDHWMAAQRFLTENELPIQSLGQIAQFLKGQIPAETADDRPFVDPFTGAGRYVPGETQTSNGGVGADPFTGAGRYVPGSSTTNGVAPSSADPFTGAGRYVPGSAHTDTPLMPNSSVPLDKQRPRDEYVPLREYFRFGPEGLASTKAVQSLFDANGRQPTERRLTDEQQEALADILRGKHDDETQLSDCQLVALQAALDWPIGDLVPVLDAFRIAILSESCSRYFCTSTGESPGGVVTRLQDLMSSDPSPAVQILVCRSLTNCCLWESGRTLLIDQLTPTLLYVVPCLLSPKAALQIAVCQLLANISLVLFTREQRGERQLGPKEDLLTALLSVLSELDSFADLHQGALSALLRALVTALWGDATALRTNGDKLKPIVARMQDAASEEGGAKHIARTLSAMLWAN